MGQRLTRQQRRQQARRQAGKPQPKRLGWSLIGGAVIVIAAFALLAGQVIGKGGGSSNASSQLPAIDGIKCGPTEMTSYHVHSHLTLLNKGRPITIPAQIGIGGCFYWVHTHDSSGIIHIEAPNGVKPTLAALFDIWGVPLSRKQFVDAKVKPGETMRAYVNQKLYYGNPRNIPIGKHTDITLEIGPPFKALRKFNFGDL
jgi:hypothetical protein